MHLTILFPNHVGSGRLVKHASVARSHPRAKGQIGDVSGEEGTGHGAGVKSFCGSALHSARE